MDNGVMARFWQRWQQLALLPLARAFVILVCLSLVATDGWLVWKARQVQLRDSEIEVSNLASALARQASDSLKKADTVLIDLVERLQVEGQGASQLQRLQGLMRQHVYEQAELHGLFAYDHDGNWLVSSFGRVPKGANNADREYLNYHRRFPDDHGPHVGAPVRSRSTGEWVIPLSRRVEDARGDLAAVVLATISIDYFRQFYRTFDIRQHGTISLVLNTGVLLLSSPYSEASVGSSIAGGQIFTHLLPERPAGTVLLPSPRDEVERISSYRQVQGYPLVIIAALARDDVLADWYQDSQRQILVICLLAGLLALLGYYLIQLIERSKHSEAELLATRDALRAFNRRLEKQALEDELTRLANRRRFIGTLGDEFARASRNQQPLSLILFDVDYFKQYNDIYGHSAGDDCLRTVAEEIRAGQKRPADLAARYGGEEFCLLLPETDAEGALYVAEQVRLAVEKLNLPHIGAPWQRLSLSAGVHTCLPLGGSLAEGPEALIHGADKALYAAKAAGRNRVVQYAHWVEKLI